MPDHNEAAVYVRVSSVEQRERKTIESQIEFAKQYCDLHNIGNFQLYRDDAVSGAKPFSERPAGKKLLSDARAKKFSTVLVYRTDRLARNTADLLNTVEALKKDGIALKSMTEPFDTSTATGEFVMTLLGSIATLELNTIRERTKLGQERNAKSGKWNGGVSPYGYRVNDEGRLEIHSAEAAVVRLVYQMYGEERKRTKEIVQYLNSRNIPTTFHQRNINRPTRKKWYPAHIMRMLSLKVYMGVMEYGKRSEIRDKAITASAPAIVDEATWRRAEEMRRQNLQKAPRNSDRIYPLRRLIYCEDCGRLYFGDGGRDRPYKYYRCSGKSTWTEGRRCNSKNLKAEQIEQIVWEDVREYIENPSGVVKLLEQKMKEQLPTEENSENELQRIDNLEREKQAERRRIITMFRKNLIRECEMESELSQTNDELVSLQLQREQLQDRKQALERIQDETVNVRIILEQLQNRLDGASEETMRDIFQVLVDKITVRTVVEEGKEVPQVTIIYRFDKHAHISECTTDGRRCVSHGM